jgi:hypothetical protein
MSLENLVRQIEAQLLPYLHIESIHCNEPVVVRKVPSSWRPLGTGNYAAVFYHPSFPEYVVKVYAPGRPGLAAEEEVYRRLGRHPSFSACFYCNSDCLVLKRLRGTTLYDCLSLGIPIPKQVIEDIDQALNYARSRGLNGHDMHGRNVMMSEGRGLVVDVSDFLNPEPCSAWEDLKWAYYHIYLPVLAPLRIKVPYKMLDLVRKTYRLFRRWLPRRCDRP